MNATAEPRQAVPAVDPVRFAPVWGRIEVRILSFGYLWHDNPAELTADGRYHAVLDLRDLLYNPFHDPSLRELTGLDDEVRDHVLANPGALALVDAYADLAVSALRQAHARSGVVTVGFGCAGGRHRSVVLANELYRLLIDNGIGAEVTHYDVTRPVYHHPADHS